MANKKTPFQLRSGNSPLKQWGLLRAIGKKIWGNKIKTVLVAGGTHQLATDKRDMSFVEKSARAVDDWTTGGLGQLINFERKGKNWARTHGYGKNKSLSVVGRNDPNKYPQATYQRGKKKNINKSTQITKGDKIKALGPED